MARSLNKLTVRSAAALADAGRHSDGGGLYLDITPDGIKSWVFLYRSPVHRTERAGKLIGKQREMGLGAFGTGESGKVSLAQARETAADARVLIAAGKDPLDRRDRQAKAATAIPTFGEMADQFVAKMAPSWKNEKHAQQWKMTLTLYAAALRDKRVNEIGVEDVLAVLNGHWEKRRETADRLRGRIERVLNAAKAHGYRTGENPAAWRGHLENLLPRRQKLSRGHHAAVPHLLREERASIVNIASGVGLLPTGAGSAAYTASKAGVIGLTRSMAAELAPNIRVNAVCPGAVDTPMTAGFLRDATGAVATSIANRYAMKRPADSAEIAAAILFLLSHEASFVTGVSLAVDGGRTFH